ncbi:hypothetical protein NOK91_23700 [Vibrio parahaemolyticus]|nr:hypothetical protein [Vibrio parahaemolyticus]
MRRHRYCVVHPLTGRYAIRLNFKVSLIFVVFNHSFLGFGKSALSAQILESLKPQNMPKFVKLPH